jgi:toxin ParE1/3/4
VALTIFDTVGSLARFPHRGRPGRSPNTRELVFPGLPFLAIYRIRGDGIEIVRILHGAQNWP